VVEDLEAQVRHPDFIQVGKAEEKSNPGLAYVLARGMEEAACVPARFRDEREVGFVQEIELVHISSVAWGPVAI
jgi:hypothetical protein